MDWGWDYTVVTPVDRHAFLINLPSAKLDWMLEGGRHVCRITFEPVIGTYGMKRRRHKKVKCRSHTRYGPEVPVWQWDWHVLLSNGKVYRVHTDL